MPDNTFFGELRKRKVVQTAAIYGAVAWGFTEVIVTVVDQLFLPQWVSSLAVIGFVVGFPVAMFLAWTFDLTSEGLQRTTIASRRGRASIAASLLLLVAGTAGLFFLIRPTIEQREQGETVLAIAANGVAVLPFENASTDPDDKYLSEGLSDELRDQLGQVAGLRIAARSSSVVASQRQADATSVSAQLGVAMLVEGSVRRRGNGLRVSVQLIEGSTGLALWSETYDRGPQELLSVQQAIAEEVTRRLLPDVEVVVTPPVTRSASANELLLLARYYEQQVRAREEVDRDTLLEAIRLYRQATEVDPDSALAQSRLAGALLYLGDLESAEAPIFRALTLNPDLSEVQYTLGLYYFARGLPGAGAAFKRAADLNPNNPDALESYANWSWMQGRTENTEVLLRRAVEFDPLSLARYGALGTFLGIETTPDKTLALIDRIETMFDGPEAYRLIGQLLELTGQVDRAIAWTIRARDLEPGNPDHDHRLAELYGVIGDFDTALSLEPEPGIGLLYRMRRYEELIDIAEFLMIEEPGDMPLRYLLAFAYTVTDQFESALLVLESAGLPGSMLEERRFSADMEGFITLMNAAYGAGDIDVARELAMFWTSGEHPANIDWWQDANGACAMSVLEFHAEALARLERIRNSPRLPWDPVLKDAVCFRRYADEPVYQETIRHLDARRAALRERLPDTLAEFGVEL
jgi:TolB-like protein/tetratricopeptide (TPR) repeat protein